ncbi:MAG TPA: hypothetical protein VMH90_04445 [Thermoplasmata archaeon]|nr:hypothetical protein [Thermoplasmata archaeon]
MVMAVLQAARAHALGLPRDAAYSWGLNRAIFIAAARSGFRGGTATAERGEGTSAPASHPTLYRLGDDEAMVDPRVPGLVFMIGGEDQTVADFEHQIIARFGTPENFQLAWQEASRYVGEFDRKTLESRGGFYEEVYRPRRDELSDAWTQKYSPPPAMARGKRPRVRKV